MKFKNTLMISLMALVLFLGTTSPAHTMPVQNLFENSFDLGEFQKRLHTFKMSYAPSTFFEQSKPSNSEIQKPQKKRFNKELLKKIKKFLKRRERQTHVKNMGPNESQTTA